MLVAHKLKEGASTRWQQLLYYQQCQRTQHVRTRDEVASSYSTIPTHKLRKHCIEILGLSTRQEQDERVHGGLLLNAQVNLYKTKPK